MESEYALGYLHKNFFRGFNYWFTMKFIEGGDDKNLKYFNRMINGIHQKFHTHAI